jgi:hypothetical protein
MIPPVERVHLHRRIARHRTASRRDASGRGTPTSRIITSSAPLGLYQEAAEYAERARLTMPSGSLRRSGPLVRAGHPFPDAQESEIAGCSPPGEPGRTTSRSNEREFFAAAARVGRRCRAARRRGGSRRPVGRRPRFKPTPALPEEALPGIDPVGPQATRASIDRIASDFYYSITIASRLAEGTP